MKKSLLLPILLSISLLTGCNKTTPEEPKKVFPDEINELLTQVSENFNFTITSEGGYDTRILEIYNKSDFYYTKQSRTRFYQNGVFYIEDQGTQDFILNSAGEVEVTFYEGPGKTDTSIEYTYDPNYYSDSAFSRIKLSDFLDSDFSSFKKSGDVYKSKDEKVNLMLAALTNAYCFNWEKDNKVDYYFDAKKSETTFEVIGESLIFTFDPYLKPIWSGGDDWDDPTLTISFIGSTSRNAVNSYKTNHNPITKRTSFIDDTESFTKAFGNISVPFVDKSHGNLLSVNEYYDDYDLQIFDPSCQANILENYEEELDGSQIWIYDKERSDAAYEIYNATTLVYVAKSEITNDHGTKQIVDVYFYLCYVDPELLSGSDLAIRPNGFFVGEIFRDINNEAIVGRDAIMEYIQDNNATGFISHIPSFNSMSYSLMDYSANSAIYEAFIAQGRELIIYYELTIGYNNESDLTQFVNQLKESLVQNDNYELDSSATGNSISASKIIPDECFEIACNVLASVERGVYKINIIVTIPLIF